MTEASMTNTPGWRAHIITLFPDMFPGPLGVSLSGRALENGAWSCATHDLRAYGEGSHRAVDDTPAGGGAGMVLRADIATAAVADARTHAGDVPLLLPSPRGTPFTQAMATELAAGRGAMFLCNRFEGVDERFIATHDLREISVGDYILSGGEMASFAMLDAIIRLLPGVMGSSASHHEESFTEDLLEYPQYTRPASWQGHDIPAVLTSGNHAEIAAWRRAQAQDITATRRPDLWARYVARHPAAARNNPNDKKSG